MELGQLRIYPEGTAQKDLGGLHQLTVMAGLGPHQANLTHVGLATGIGTTGPVASQGLGQLQAPLQLINGRLGRGLGGDQGKTAIAASGTTHRLRLQGPRVRTKPLQQRFR